MNEKELGPAHMMSKEELQRFFPHHALRYHRDGRYFASKAPGAENYIDLFVRLHSMLDTLRRDWARKKVAICCHSAVMLIVRQLFEHYPPDDLLRIGEKEWIENCGILHYHRPAGLWGWRRGKFRIELARPPYHLWTASDEQKQIFWERAMIELKDLKKITADE